MTTNDAIVILRLYVNDPNETNGRYTSAQVLAILNRAIKDCARELKLPQRTSPLTSVAQQQEYSCVVGTIEIYEVTYDGYLLEPFEYREVLKLKEYLVTNNIYGTPDVYYILENGDALKLGFYPIPSIANKTINVRNAYQPDDVIAGGDMPYTIEDYNELSILLASSRLLASDNTEWSISKSRYFKGLYDDKLVGIRIDVRQRESPDYVNYIED